MRSAPPALLASIEQRASAAGFALDDAQRAAAAVLARVATEADSRSRSGLRRLMRPRRDGRTNAPRSGASRDGAGDVAACGPAGVYLWGEVGRGKTWLMDAFVASRPREEVLRVHVHQFFRDLHAGIGRHRGHRGAMTEAVADLLEGRTTVAFDELHVHDPGDAMLLAPLIRELVRRRAVWVATSNYPPERLLGNPLYHHLFAPVIDLIRDHSHVLHLDGARDHRIGRAAAPDRAGPRGFSAGAWLVGPGTRCLREHRLDVRSERRVAVPLGSREVWARAVDGTTVWFCFSDLVEGRLGTVDYLELASRFTTWVLLGTPMLRCASEAARQRFVALIDVLCDLDRRLVLAGAPAPERLFEDVSDPPDLARAVCRLRLLSLVDTEQGEDHSGHRVLMPRPSA